MNTWKSLFESPSGWITALLLATDSAAEGSGEGCFHKERADFRFKTGTAAGRGKSCVCWILIRRAATIHCCHVFILSAVHSDWYQTKKIFKYIKLLIKLFVNHFYGRVIWFTVWNIIKTKESSFSFLLLTDPAESNLRSFQRRRVHGAGDPMSPQCLPRTQRKSSPHNLTPTQLLVALFGGL